MKQKNEVKLVTYRNEVSPAYRIGEGLSNGAAAQPISPLALNNAGLIKGANEQYGHHAK